MANSINPVDPIDINLVATTEFHLRSVGHTYEELEKFILHLIAYCHDQGMSPPLLQRVKDYGKSVLDDYAICVLHETFEGHFLKFCQANCRVDIYPGMTMKEHMNAYKREFGIL